MNRAWNPQVADNIVAAQMHLQAPLLPALHALQEEFGYISEDAMRLLATRLNITRAEVYGVVSFYHDYRQQPAGRHVLKLCRAEACQSMGAEQNSARLLKLLGLDWGGTTADGKLTVEPVYCLGLCACAPSAMLDETLHARLTPDSLETLVSETLARDVLNMRAA